MLSFIERKNALVAAKVASRKFGSYWSFAGPMRMSAISRQKINETITPITSAAMLMMARFRSSLRWSMSDISPDSGGGSIMESWVMGAPPRGYARYWKWVATPAKSW